MRRDPDHAEPTRWASLTGLLGAALAVAGGVLLFVGWWGVSGESIVALQLPYVASASIPGAALLVAGGVLLAGEPARRNSDQSAQLIETLYDLLTEAAAPAEAHAPAVAHATAEAHATGATGLVTIPGATRYHQATCALVQGKRDVTPVDGAAIREQRLQPCPICSPSLRDG